MRELKGKLNKKLKREVNSLRSWTNVKPMGKTPA